MASILENENFKELNQNYLSLFAKEVSFTLLRNFDAYKYAFFEEREEEYVNKFLCVSTPLNIPPLENFSND